MMMPRMTDAEFWRRHLKEGRYPVIPIHPNEDFANSPFATRRLTYSVASFERERRSLRAPDPVPSQTVEDARRRLEAHR
jgi:hypothetical protein